MSIARSPWVRRVWIVAMRLELVGGVGGASAGASASSGRSAHGTHVKRRVPSQSSIIESGCLQSGHVVGRVMVLFYLLLEKCQSAVRQGVW